MPYLTGAPGAPQLFMHFSLGARHHRGAGFAMAVSAGRNRQ
jgi:hypothetical protein